MFEERDTSFFREFFFFFYQNIIFSMRNRNAQESSFSEFLLLAKRSFLSISFHYPSFYPPSNASLFLRNETLVQPKVRVQIFINKNIVSPEPCLNYWNLDSLIFQKCKLAKHARCYGNERKLAYRIIFFTFPRSEFIGLSTWDFFIEFTPHYSSFYFLFVNLSFFSCYIFASPKI